MGFDPAARIPVVHLDLEPNALASQSEQPAELVVSGLRGWGMLSSGTLLSLGADALSDGPGGAGTWSS